ncbi:Hypothetical predicted protein [Podarcis lilfordi]|uniref:C-type lectin domain-containing protein n=1 Tax=Podarcis lilfordi TaxID=74358 RepID=A0AA35JZF2_9SAUR|nr:Hypothetical predicted protein [Podarcis lilfordi]
MYFLSFFLSYLFIYLFIYLFLFFIKCFLRRYKGPADYWIGLQKMNDQEPWKWIDGTIFNNWFKIWGGGECAYINHQSVASSSGRAKNPGSAANRLDDKRHWMCTERT